MFLCIFISIHFFFMRIIYMFIFKFMVAIIIFYNIHSKWFCVILFELFFSISFNIQICIMQIGLDYFVTIIWGKMQNFVFFSCNIMDFLETVNESFSVWYRFLVRGLIVTPPSIGLITCWFFFVNQGGPVLGHPLTCGQNFSV